MFEDDLDNWRLFNIDPELTCTCDEFHVCQQCMEDDCNENSLGLGEELT